jgi:tetratricopeptide (TPR) repeat protein
MKKLIFISTILVSLMYQSVKGCTIFTASNSQKVLVGNNEDNSPNLKTYLWITPSTNVKYGFMTWGSFKKKPEGGMNEKGLFWDAAAMPQKIDIVRDAHKTDFKGYFVEKALSECATVEEVIKLVSQYNLLWQEKAQILVADASGDYAVIHANYIIRKSDIKQSHFALTNFRLNCSKSGYCNRFQMTEKLLSQNEFSEESFKNILAKTAQNNADNATLYSQVCDLRNGTITLFQKNDFAHAKVLNIAEALQQGEKSVEIKQLFPENISENLQKIIEKQGIEKGMEAFEMLKNHPQMFFIENTLNEIGYSLLNNGDTEGAIKIFTLNQKEFPNSEVANASLASAYSVYGDKKSAKKYFDKTLEINSLNVQAATFGNQQDGWVTFRLQGYEGAKKVALVGNFNQYQNDKNLFQKTANGDWECRIKLPKGVFYYKFLVEDNNWINDPANKVSYKPVNYWDSVVVVN